MNYWPLLFLPNLLLLGDWLKHRREVSWFFVLAAFGPLGATAYTMYFWDSITFPMRPGDIARRFDGPGPKRCGRCQQVRSGLEWVEDGRTRHLMCAQCAREIVSARNR